MFLPFSSRVCGAGHMRGLSGALLSILCFASLVITGSTSAFDEDEDFFVSYTVDDYKTAFISGNLTAAVTHDWPRVAFYHTEDIFSPTFEIGSPAIYLFNDTDGNGMFVRSEMTYLAYLDAHHNVTWNISDVVVGVDPLGGQYAVLNRWADIALFDDREALEPVIDRWARMSFSFKLTENPVTYQNELGAYVVKGKIDMRVNFTLEILSPVNSSGVVVEQSLKGGMNTNTFLLTEDLGLDYLVQTQALARIDETENGEDFAHRFNLSGLPSQRVDFAKEDGTVQAYYRVSSVPLLSQGAGATRTPMNCSYYTTGTGLVLHTALLVSNATGNITQDMSLGIDEAGFYTGVRDWLTENLPAIMVVSGTAVVLVCLALFVIIRRRSRKEASAERDGPVEPPAQKPPAA